MLNSFIHQLTQNNYLFIWLLALWSLPLSAQEELADIRTIQQQLIKLDIAELLEIEVTSVAKKTQTLAESAAAIFVITQEDIRRSAATTLPEVLRTVPGLQVARINSHAWAISARGFNSYFSSYLLVLLDGRSVYSRNFSGAFWDVLDTPLEDIERIEIIRGPGGTLWGANAINGVINIITKNAAATQGNLAVATLGTQEQTLTLRHGGKLHEPTQSDFRLHAKISQHEAFANIPQEESWHAGQIGFRIDAHPKPSDNWTFQGKFYQNHENDMNYQTLQPSQVDIQGGHLLSRWERKFSQNANLMVQMYYDSTRRDYSTLHLRDHVFDFELQHRLTPSMHQEFLWGLGLRHYNNEIPDSSTLKANPSQLRENLFSAFAQHDIDLSPNQLTLTLGTKLEHNNYTHLEIQPNARLLWRPNPQRSFWAALSRAVRIPSRAEHDILVQATVPPARNPLYPMPLAFQAIGNSNLDSSSVLAYEIGFRTQLNPGLSLDIAAYFNQYQNLIILTQKPQFIRDPQQLIVVNDWSNEMKGETFGFELALDWFQNEKWRLQAAYTYLQMQLHLNEDIPSSNEDNENQNPHHQFSLHTSTNWLNHWELDFWLRYVDDLPSEEMNYVDSYITLDARLAWKLSKHLELSLIGKNLLDKQYAEFGPEDFNPLAGEVQRNVYGQLRWQF